MISELDNSFKDGDMRHFYSKVKQLTKINKKTQIVTGILTSDGAHLDEERVEMLIADNYANLMGKPLFQRSDEENTLLE